MLLHVILLLSQQLASPSFLQLDSKQAPAVLAT